jgi:hypothetical protein
MARFVFARIIRFVGHHILSLATPGQRTDHAGIHEMSESCDSIRRVCEILNLAYWTNFRTIVVAGDSEHLSHERQVDGSDRNIWSRTDTD